MTYLVVNFRNLRNYGSVRALRFSFKFDNYEKALRHIASKPDWYDYHIIPLDEESEKGDYYDSPPCVQ